MIPITQDKVVIKDSKGEVIVHGNCYAAAIASLIELPLSEVPNVEVFFHLPTESSYWQEVMLTFLESKGFELCSDDRFRVFHDGTFGLDNGMRAEWLNKCKNKYYLVSGMSNRGFSHMVVYQNGKLVHDPHPSREGVNTIDSIQTIEKIKKDYPIGGYAPGSYQCKCCTCGEKFVGDKRSVQCEPCAEKMISDQNAQECDATKAK